MKKLCALLATLALGYGLGTPASADEDPLHFFFNQGVEAYFNGDNAAARKQFDTCIENGRDPRYFYFRGLTRLQQGEANEADQDFAYGAELELDRIEFRDLALNESKRMSEVNGSLQRVQGAPRNAIERFRWKVYPVVRDSQIYKDARVAAIRQQILAEVREREANRPKSLQDLVGEVIELHGERVRVIQIDEYQGGIRSLTAIDPSISLDPNRFARTSINTGHGFATGEAALQFVIQRDSRNYYAADLVRLEHAKLPTELMYNPLHNILSDPESARAGWAEHHRLQAERARLAALEAERQRALRQRAEDERLSRLAEEQRQAQERIAAEQRLAQERAAEEQRLAEARYAEEQRLAQERYAQQITQDKGFHSRPAVTGSGAAGPAIAKIIGAVVLNGYAHEADNRSGFVAAFVSVGGRFARDMTIASAIRDVFPNLDNIAIRGTQIVISLILDGRLNLTNVGEESAKQLIIEALQREDPRLGHSAELGDFLYQLSVRYQSSR